MRVELFQISVILGVCVVKDAIKRASLVNDVLPPSFEDCDVWLVIPTGLSKTLQNVWMSFDNRMMSWVVALKLDLT